VVQKRLSLSPGLFLHLFLRPLGRGRLLDTTHRIWPLLTEAFGIELPNAFRQSQLPCGSWSWLSSFPSFFGFIPSSRAICTCSCDRWKRRRASIQGCKLGIRGCFFVISAVYYTCGSPNGALWNFGRLLRSAAFASGNPGAVPSQFRRETRLELGFPVVPKSSVAFRLSWKGRRTGRFGDLG
jgi:hypothetical protein